MEQEICHETTIHETYLDPKACAICGKDFSTGDTAFCFTTPAGEDLNDGWMCENCADLDPLP